MSDFRLIGLSYGTYFPEVQLRKDPELQQNGTRKDFFCAFIEQKAQNYAILREIRLGLNT